MGQKRQFYRDVIIESPLNMKTNAVNVNVSGYDAYIYIQQHLTKMSSSNREKVKQPLKKALLKRACTSSFPKMVSFGVWRTRVREEAEMPDLYLLLL